ncbi:MAG: SPOR domain-containing protein [Pseudomonadota bacterium]|nr:SPOR domain-containing protein [Pseudomonadota bacterium]
MSMSDERASLARTSSRSGQVKGKAPVKNQKTAAPRPSPASIPGVGAPSGGVLPGLAAFGKLQGVAAAPVAPQRPQAARSAPVDTPPAPAPARNGRLRAVPVEPVYEPEEVQEEETYSLAGEGHEEASYADNAGHEQNGSGFSFSDEDLQALIDGPREQEQSAAQDNYFEEPVEAEADAGEFDGNGYDAASDENFVFEDESAAAGGDADEVADSYDVDFDKGASRALKTFEAGYDGPPEIRLDSYGRDGDEDAPQPFFNDGDVDAAFLDQEFDPAAAAPAAKEGRGRKFMMVGSALVGALALGGAFAFAYKIGGGSVGSGDSQPPLIQADARPAKVAPAEPGGKEFPHKNKLIYERLQGTGEPQNEQLVPRQEQVADANKALAPSGTSQPTLRPGEGQKQVAALPQSADASTTPTPAATEASPEAPRKVRTLLVRPDGTLVQPSSEQPAAAAAPAPAPAPAPVAVATAEPRPLAAPAPQPAPVQKQASVEPVRPAVLGAEPTATAEPAPAPTPVQQPAAMIPPPLSKPSPPPVTVASAPAAPAPQAASDSGSYVVQVAARKSQADALAAFADLQQKYPDLLSGYRPIIKKADLGDKGVWYRLSVGPLSEKSAAGNLCGKLKGAGISSCLVREE